MTKEIIATSRYVDCNPIRNNHLIYKYLFLINNILYLSCKLKILSENVSVMARFDNKELYSIIEDLIEESRNDRI